MIRQVTHCIILGFTLRLFSSYLWVALLFKQLTGWRGKLEWSCTLGTIQFQIIYNAPFYAVKMIACFNRKLPLILGDDPAFLLGSLGAGTRTGVECCSQLLTDSNSFVARYRCGDWWWLMLAFVSLRQPHLGASCLPAIDRWFLYRRPSSSLSPRNTKLQSPNGIVRGRLKLAVFLLHHVYIVHHFFYRLFLLHIHVYIVHLFFFFFCLQQRSCLLAQIIYLRMKRHVSTAVVCEDAMSWLSCHAHYPHTTPVLIGEKASPRLSRHQWRHCSRLNIWNYWGINRLLQL